MVCVNFIVFFIELITVKLSGLIVMNVTINVGILHMIECGVQDSFISANVLDFRSSSFDHSAVVANNSANLAYPPPPNFIFFPLLTKFRLCNFTGTLRGPSVQANNATLSNCSFLSAIEGALVLSGDFADIRSVQFFNNSATRGGALYIEARVDLSPVKIQDAQVSNPQSPSTYCLVCRK